MRNRCLPFHLHPTGLLRGVTLVELLVVLAILALLFALLIRPMSSALEIVNLGGARTEVDARARQAMRQLTEELSQALYVRSNFGYLDVLTGEVRASQRSRLDVILPDDVLESGSLLTPLLPEVNSVTGEPTMVTYLVMLREPYKLDGAAFMGHDPLENPYVLYRFQYPLRRGLPDPELLAPDDPVLWEPDYAWAQRYYDPLGPDEEPVLPNFEVFGSASRSVVTTNETDVVDARFLPLQVRNEVLRPGEHYTRFSARQSNWVRPYQVEGRWIMPGSLLNDSGALLQPALVLSRNGAPAYYLDVNNDPNVNPGLLSGSTVGHVMVYRAGDGVAVYDTTVYPMRALDVGDPLFAEFACGVNWERGEILTGFENIDPRTGNPYEAMAADGSRQYLLALDAALLPEATIIPGSAQVTVVQGGASRTYRVLETEGAAFLEPRPDECHLNLDPNPGGRFVLTFPARVGDAWNPPAPGAGIFVRYRYRTHAPNLGRPVPDTWTASYWTSNQITAHLALDMLTNTSLTNREKQTIRVQSAIQIRNAEKRY